MEMTIEVQKRGAVSVVRAAGDLAGKDGGKFLKAVTDLLGFAKARVVLDLSQVPMITSAGLGELVRVTAQANTQGGRVLLAGLTPFVGGVLETTKLNSFFEVCPDVDTAVARLS
jgi:anti-anti-sigma factor